MNRPSKKASTAKDCASRDATPEDSTSEDSTSAVSAAKVAHAKTPETPLPAGKITVFYDGSCPSCIRDRQRYEQWAGKRGEDVCWLDITGREQQLERLGIDPDKALKELHLRDLSGQIRSELDAYILLMGRVPRLKPLAWLLGLPLIRPVLAWLYHWVVNRRLRRQGRMPP